MKKCECAGCKMLLVMSLSFIRWLAKSGKKPLCKDCRRKNDQNATTSTRSLDQIIKTMGNLPVFQMKGKIIAALKSVSPTFISGPTGSGKSIGVAIISAITQAKGHQTLIAEPTRVAVRGLAKMCNELCEGDKYDFGQAENGQVRYTKNTGVVFATYGHVIRVLLRIMKTKNYKKLTRMTIVVDEAHDAGADNRVLLLLLAHLYLHGARIVIMSATLENAPIHDLFHKEMGVNRIDIKGRQYPVDIQYWDRDFDQSRSGIDEKNHAMLKTAMRLVEKKRQGTILVFLTGEAEINHLLHVAKAKGYTNDVLFLPAYGSMPQSDYDSLLKPHEGPVIVLATNMVEASVTIPNVTTVLDGGLQKILTETPNGDMVLKTVPTSKAAAIQRAGRAGRMGPGNCIRFYRKQFEDTVMQPADASGFDRLNPDSYILLFLENGFFATETMHVLRQDPTTFKSRIERMKSLGVLNEDAQVTDLGKFVSQMPMSMPLAVALYHAKESDKETKLFVALTAAFAAYGGHNPQYIPREYRRNSTGYQSDWFARFLGRYDAETLWKYFLAFHVEAERMDRKAMLKWCTANSMNNKMLQGVLRSFVRNCAKIGLKQPLLSDVDWSRVGFNPFDLYGQYDTADFSVRLLDKVAQAFARSFPGRRFKWDKGELVRTCDNMVHGLNNKLGYCWGTEEQGNAPYQCMPPNADIYRYDSGFPQDSQVICLNVISFETHRGTLHLASCLLPLLPVHNRTAEVESLPSLSDEEAAEVLDKIEDLPRYNAMEAWFDKNL